MSNDPTPREWAAPTATAPIDAVIPVPGSKSASNRALILAALADDASTISGLLDARDTRLMIAGLTALGVDVEERPGSDAGNIDVTVRPHFLRGPASIDCGLAGTVMRFLPPVAALAHGAVTFDGDAAARRRPMATTIESLRDLGVVVDDGRRGRLPFTVHATGEVTGGEVWVDASRSSQFVSGLLLSAARFEAGVTIHHVGPPVPSQPHIDMTIRMLADHGVLVRHEATTWHVDPHDLRALDRSIEPDLSNAAPFLAAALVAGGAVTVPGWPIDSIQPGAAVVDLLTAMGAIVSRSDDGVCVRGDGVIRGLDVDLSAVGELTPTIAALAALADSPSRLRGIAHLRGHETDRLAALVELISTLGGCAVETADGLEIAPSTLHGSRVRTHGDHRIATAAAILGLRVPDITLDDVTVTDKTLPGFAERWSMLLGSSTS